jgi:ParB family chromosome partitioning protein
VQAALRDKEVAMGHARALIAIDDEEAQVELLEETIEEDLSVREVEKRARNWHDEQEEDEEDESDDGPSVSAEPDREELQLDDYRSKLRSRFSTQVKINHKTDGEGSIEVSYYSEEDLERLVELMMEE